MEPKRESSLVEILDRLLNKGAVLNADVIISVAGVPLIGLNLRAVLASMETMLEYGIMEDWDKSSRQSYVNQQATLRLNPKEEILFKAFGYLWQDEGLISSWIPGTWNVTTERLILWLKSPGKIVFEMPLEDLCVKRIQESTTTRYEFELLFPGGMRRISLHERDEFEEALAKGKSMNLAEIAVPF